MRAFPTARLLLLLAVGAVAGHAAQRRKETEEPEPILIYNRVPKAGSSFLVNGVLGHLQWRNNFTIVSDPNYYDTESMLSIIAEMNPGDVYSSHQHFVPDVGRPAVWMNMLREPLARDNSLFYYGVDYRNQGEHALAELDRRKADPQCGCAGLEYETCVIQRDEQGCYDRILCNPQEDAFVEYDNQTHHTPMDVVFKTIVQNFAAVGITEEMDLSIALFEKVLPRWFEGASTLNASLTGHRATNIENDLTPGTHLNGCISNEAKSILKHLPSYKAQSDLYRMVKNHFWRTVVWNGLVPAPSFE